MYSKNIADSNSNKYLIFRIKNNKILIYQDYDPNNYIDKKILFFKNHLYLVLTCIIYLNLRSPSSSLLFFMNERCFWPICLSWSRVSIHRTTSLGIRTEITKTKQNMLCWGRHIHKEGQEPRKGAHKWKGKSNKLNLLRGELGHHKFQTHPYVSTNGE